MTHTEPQTQQAQISPDGQWQWNGKDWVPNEDPSAVASASLPTSPEPMQPSHSQSEKSGGNAWAIVALVLAILAISISWIPLLNNISPIFSVLALILAIPAFIKARKGASGKGLTIASVVLSVLAFVLVLGTQAMFSNAIDDIGESMEQSNNSLSVTLGEPTTDSTGWTTVPVTVSNAGPEDLSGGSATVQASDGGTVVGEALVSIPRLKVGQTAAETADFFEALPSGATFEVVDKDGYTFG